MPVQVRRVDPLEWREAIVDFFWNARIWPHETKADYFRHWDWRCSAVSEQLPAVWVALEGGQVVGHIAVNFRQLRYDGQLVHAGVPANFRLDARLHNSLVGAGLAGAPWQMVRAGEIDLLLGYGNQIAHALFVARGVRELGSFNQYVDVRRWGPVLRRRLPAGAALAPLAGAASRLLRLAGRRRRAPPAVPLVARHLTRAEVVGLDRSHWAVSKDFVLEGSHALLADRFLGNPFREHTVIGIFATGQGRVEGLVVTEGKARVSILDCRVNEDVLSEVQAVEMAIAVLPDTDNVIVPLLPRTQLASEFSAAGYLRRRGDPTAETIGQSLWSAHWRPEHPLASRFEDLRRWKLWYAWSHH
jgi:hypothetical protein